MLRFQELGLGCKKDQEDEGSYMKVGEETGQSRGLVESSRKTGKAELVGGQRSPAGLRNRRLSSGELLVFEEPPLPLSTGIPKCSS